MNLIAKYAGRVIQLRKAIGNYDKGEILTLVKIQLIDNNVQFEIEDKPILLLNIPQGINNLEKWLSRYIKLLY